MKINKLLITSMVLALSGCATETAALNEHEQKLQWVEQADAVIDAQEAMKNNDYRLLALPGRGQVIPGIDVELRAKYASKCGTRLVQGVTDAVRGETHLKLLKMAREYAREYNALIKPHCQR